jgi:hypothetical protein
MVMPEVRARRTGPAGQRKKTSQQSGGNRGELGPKGHLVSQGQALARLYRMMFVAILTRQAPTPDQLADTAACLRAR